MIAEANQRFEVGTVYIGEPLQHLVLADTGFGALVDDPTRLFGNRTVDFPFPLGSGAQRGVARRLWPQPTRGRWRSW